jgi:hypothetical protein
MAARCLPRPTARASFIINGGFEDDAEGMIDAGGMLASYAAHDAISEIGLEDLDEDGDVALESDED